MADKQLFSNNAETTLNGAITNVATSIVVTDGSVFNAPAAGEYQLATITDLNGDSTEIVKITGVVTNTLTVVRAQEGTTGIAHADGLTISNRVTAGMLDTLVQNDPGGNARGANSVNIQPSRLLATEVASGANAIAIGKNTIASGSDSTAIGVDAEATVQNSVALGDSASVTGGNNGVAIGNLAATSDVNCIAIGNAASSTEAQGIAIGDSATVNGLGNAGGVAIGDTATASKDDSIAIGRSASCAEYNSVSIGLLASCTVGDDCVAIGSSSDAKNLEAVALGHNAQATATYSVSIGPDSDATASQAVALGNLAYAQVAGSISIGASSWAYGTNTICIGKSAGHNSDYSVSLSTGKDVTISGRATPYNISIGKTDYSPAGYATSIAGPDFLPLEHGTYIGGTTAASHHLMQATERTFFSPPVQAGAKVWTATTAYDHNEVITPSTPTGQSYYARLSSPYGGAVTSGGTEPTWTGSVTNGSTVVEGNITWVCVENTNMVFHLPDYLRFIPVEVGFIGDGDLAATGTQPTIEFGTAGVTNKWLTATLATDLSGAYARDTFGALTNTEGSADMGANITSQGTLSKSGRVFWKGICVEALTA